MTPTLKWLVILLGNDRTGKTQLQKNLVRLLSGENRDNRLDCNLGFPVTHPYLIRKLRSFSVGSRSYQERPDYNSVPDYFCNHFREADLAFISSHLVASDIREMITEAHRRFYNVCGLFFSNSISTSAEENAAVSDLAWDERWLATNNHVEDETQQNRQLQSVAETLVQMLIERTRCW